MIQGLLTEQKPDFKQILDIALEQERRNNEIQGQKVLSIFKIKDDKITNLEVELESINKEHEKFKELLED